MQQMVTSALGLAEIPEPADAADALAVALCHAHLTRANERMEVAMSLTPVTVVSSRKIRAAQIRPRNQARTAHVFHP
jgi:crossover junction endodeoxyribonuclease RuvC